MFNTKQNIAFKFLLSGFGCLSLLGIVLGMMSFMMTSPIEKANQHLALANSYQIQAFTLPANQRDMLLDASKINIISSISYTPYAQKNWSILNDVYQQKRAIAKNKTPTNIVSQNLIVAAD